MSDGYLSLRRKYGSLSGGRLIGPVISQITLIQCRNANWTIFLQTLNIDIATPGFEGSYWVVTDSTLTPISGVIPTDRTIAPGFPTSFNLDFGVEGIPLAAGAGLVLNGITSAAQGSITWDAFPRLTSTVDLSSNKE